MIGESPSMACWVFSLYTRALLQRGVVGSNPPKPVGFFGAPCGGSRGFCIWNLRSGDALGFTKCVSRTTGSYKWTC